MEYITLAVVVDDLAFSSNSTRLMDMLKERLSANFKVKLFGNFKSFIGWNIKIEKDEIKIDQRAYALSLLKEHGYEQANAVHMPLPRTADLTAVSPSENIFAKNEHSKYRSIIGG